MSWLLRELGSSSARLKVAETTAADERRRRDELVLALARNGVPYTAIGEAADLSVQAVGKITRRAGVRRYKPRSAGAAAVGATRRRAPRRRPADSAPADSASAAPGG